MADFLLSTFRRDMDEVIQRLNSERPPHVKCQILLVQFMTDVIATRAADRVTREDEEMLEDMIVWEEKCEDGEDLVQAFSTWIKNMRPAFLARMGCDYRRTVRRQQIDNFNHFSTTEITPLYHSVFVLDLMVRTSTLSGGRKTEWAERVLRNWLEETPGNEEDATDVLTRAEAFFADQAVFDEVVRSLGDILLRSIGHAFTSQNPYVLKLT
jgi:hypothetical protein